MEKEQRQRIFAEKKREKAAAERERTRLRAEIARDKAERRARGGKLSGKLSAEGYNPTNPSNGKVDVGETLDVAKLREGKIITKNAAAAAAASTTPPAEQVDTCVARLAAYKVGGDGGNALKMLILFVGNVVKNPAEPKYKSINTQSKAYLKKIKPFVGGVKLLLAVGFAPTADGEKLTLPDDHDAGLLADTLAKLEATLKAYVPAVLSL